MEKKLSPLQTVAREMDEHSSMTQLQIEVALGDVLSHLQRRAGEAIDEDPDSTEAIAFSRQYQAVSETILFLGTQLIAYEDITLDDEDRVKN